MVEVHLSSTLLSYFVYIIIALCVVGNKTDLSDQREVSRERGEDFAHQIGAMYTETSASENTGNIIYNYIYST